ncbi:MAG: zf-HC2 domain-containing protein [Chloroflexota bacterium]
MSPHTHITCQELVELITEYFDGAMPSDERALFDRHMHACGACRTYVDQMRTTIELMGNLTTDTIPPQAEKELLNIFRHWKRTRDGE